VTVELSTLIPEVVDLGSLRTGQVKMGWFTLNLSEAKPERLEVWWHHHWPDIFGPISFNRELTKPPIFPLGVEFQLDARLQPGFIYNDGLKESEMMVQVDGWHFIVLLKLMIHPPIR